MPGEIWVIGEAQAGGLARVSAEVATLARAVWQQRPPRGARCRDCRGSSAGSRANWRATCPTSSR